MSFDNETLVGGSMPHTQYSRRTAMKLASAGLVGSALLPNSVAAGHGNFKPDAAVIIFDALFPGIGPERFQNVTADPNSDHKLSIHGAAFFENGESDVIGGGPYTILEKRGGPVSRGLWTADNLVPNILGDLFTPYGHSGPWPVEWKGGLLEMDVTFTDDDGGPVPGIGSVDTMEIECWVGTDDDPQQNPQQGVRVGNYTEIVEFATVFNHAEGLD